MLNLHISQAVQKYSRSMVITNPISIFMDSTPVVVAVVGSGSSSTCRNIFTVMLERILVNIDLGMIVCLVGII